MPRMVPILHENVAISMAHGYYLATGRPQAVMVHVNVGTANALLGLIAAQRDRVPLLLAAGRSPVSQAGRPGSRTSVIHWGQEMFDQAGSIREFTKWDYELRVGEDVTTVVDRALAIAMSEPRGPVYLSLPRETLAESLPADDLGAGRRVRSSPSRLHRPLSPAISLTSMPACQAVCPSRSRQWTSNFFGSSNTRLPFNADSCCGGKT